MSVHRFSATDADSDTLIYSLSGTHAGRFTIDSTTGQLKVRQGGFENLNYYDEGQRKSSVTVTVSDRNGGN